MTRSMLIGIAAALLAALAWSMNFVVPYVIGDYSVFDFAVFRFVISGAIGFGFLAFKWDLVRLLTLRDWLTAFWLGFIGYVGYFLTVVGAAIFAGPVVAPAFLGLVPIVLAIAGNLRQPVLQWRGLVVPLALTVIGLTLVNISVFEPVGLQASRSLMVGIPLAIAAVILWTWFGLANQAALAERPGMDGAVWTALIMAGGGLEMLAFVPIGQMMGVFEVPRLGLSWHAAAALYLWGVSLAIFASVGGALAWTLAAKRLPVTLCAQLIVSETVFGSVFGLAAHGRLPTLTEAAGIALLTGGVVAAIGAFKRNRIPGHEAI
ncbi:DMT family transporter [Rhizobium sp. CG5]|uniref:DMT family transporter n=1 Tax=Rhizobium sp. CG5 TaxID=2726076 RepID=UPI002033C332|nr:DMT family transporter [Rhizobium sp. CG5]MCM2475393.1 DMT family transporter [Rhizobium sp. CG5]